MARNSDYQEKNRPILTILYVIAVIALVAALVLMYMNYRERQGEYEKLVREASRSDLNLNIESRRDTSEVEEESEEAEPTATPAPTEVPIPTAAPAEQETSDGEADQQPGLPLLDVENNAG